MSRKLIALCAACLLITTAEAQTGVGSKLGISTVAVDTALAQSALPRCSEVSLCSTTDYIFTGNGFWTDATNWRDNVVPPPLLPAGKTITINPLAGGECKLNIRQTIADGALLTILPTKRLNVGDNLVFLKN